MVAIWLTKMRVSDAGTGAGVGGWWWVVATTTCGDDGDHS